MVFHSLDSTLKVYPLFVSSHPGGDESNRNVHCCSRKLHTRGELESLPAAVFVVFVKNASPTAKSGHVTDITMAAEDAASPAGFPEASVNKIGHKSPHLSVCFPGAALQTV